MMPLKAQRSPVMPVHSPHLGKKPQLQAISLDRRLALLRLRQSSKASLVHPQTRIRSLTFLVYLRDNSTSGHPA
jgi:hypothetical protein